MKVIKHLFSSLFTKKTKEESYNIAIKKIGVPIHFSFDHCDNHTIKQEYNTDVIYTSHIVNNIQHSANIAYKEQDINTNKKEIKNKNEEIIYQNKKEYSFMEVYLVVLDTKNRPEVKDHGLKGGLKNFYFVYAKSQIEAIEKVLSTFARFPHIVEQIQYSLKATPMKNILNTIGEKLPLWSYIPFCNAQRFPGQQSTPPLQKTDPLNSDVIIPMKPEEISTPITPPNQSDIDVNEIHKLKAKVSTTNTQQVTHTGNEQNDDIKVLLTKLLSLLQNNANTNVPTTNNFETQPVKSNGPVVYRVENPESDAELLSRMREVLQSSRPRHINTTEDDGGAFNSVVEMNEREIENFKQLSPEELEKKNKQIINDILKE